MALPLCLAQATPHPFEEPASTAFLLPFVAVFGQGRCQAGCKGAKGDLLVEHRRKVAVPSEGNTTGPALACEANSLPLTVFVLVRDPSRTYLFFLHYIGAL